QSTGGFPVDDIYVTGTTYQLPTLPDGTSFVWDVAACNQNGCSARSVNGQFRTGNGNLTQRPVGDLLMQCLMAGNGRLIPHGGARGYFANLLVANGRIAMHHTSDSLFAKLDWFHSMVRNGAPWDYKQIDPDFENFGNFHFGFTGSAAGIADSLLLRGAGWAQSRAGTSDPQWGRYYGFAPYGDDPNDQTYIRQGI
ncbi:MAG: polymorphic toxin type 44 domain-containing protein, partial [Flammeovirgaceae bacterium]